MKSLRKLKREIGTLYYALKDDRTPLFAKIWIFIVVGYALSPIDLIPDFIPVLGYVDDAILLPIGVFIALKIIPKNIIEDARLKASSYFEKDRPQYKWFSIITLLTWLLLAIIIIKVWI